MGIGSAAILVITVNRPLRLIVAVSNVLSKGERRTLRTVNPRGRKARLSSLSQRVTLSGLPGYPLLGLIGLPRESGLSNLSMGTTSSADAGTPFATFSRMLTNGFCWQNSIRLRQF